MKKMMMAILTVAACGCDMAVAEIENVTHVLNMYSCQRAFRKGDILTVLVTENTASSKVDNLSTSKEDLAEAEAPIMGAFGFPNGGPSISSISDHVAVPSYKIKASSSFKGAGAGNTSERLTTSYGVMVVDTLDNGLLVVRGDRRVQIKMESVNLVISGLVRVRDISAENTIDSNQISNAHIYYENSGEITRGSNPGWFWTTFQFLNPF